MRTRPSTHIRRVHMRYGRRARIINPGRRRARFTAKDYRFANASISEKLDWLTRLSRQQAALAEKAADPATPPREKEAIRGHIAVLNRDKDERIDDIRRLNRLYFPTNPRRVTW